jgi:acyl-coenzyme A thioesterase PaaI-like protein
MVDTNTHLAIDPEWVGTALSLSEGQAQASLTTHARMAADARGLVHGGFVFGLADYAAMLAVNDPHVVLGASEVRFLKPVVVGDVVVASAVRESGTGAGKKHVVRVSCARGDDVVFEGTFTCFVLPEHVLGRDPTANQGAEKS